MANAHGDVVRARDGLAPADKRDEEARAPVEERPGDGEERRESDRAGGDLYEPLAFFSSAVIAGTISWRFPTTA
jgi:hypothetical protein